MTTETLMADAATTTEGAATSTTATATTEAAVAGQGAEATATTTDAASTADAGKADDAPQGAPESYTDFTFAEGKSLAADMSDELKALAKDLNLPQEQAQKLADLALKRSDAATEAQMQALDKARTEWADATRSDKEFGGDAFDANLAVAKKGLDTLGTPELKALLNESGLGNHPEVVRLLYRAGKALSEDKIVTGAAGKTSSADTAKSFYSNSNMNS